MVRAKILSKRRKYSKGTSKMKLKSLMDYSPTEELLDKDLIAKAIWECLKDNDYEGVIEVIEAHMKAVNKVKA